MTESWPHTWLGMADDFARRRSKYPGHKVGAVIVDGKHPIAWGFNGLPRGMNDEYWYGKLPRDELQKLVVHAETNACLRAPGSCEGMTLYSTLPPCSRCAAVIANKQISYVVSCPPTTAYERDWAEDIEFGREILFRARISTTYIDISDARLKELADLGQEIDGC